MALRDCGEGPWESEEEALEFAEAEVGLPWQVEQRSDGWHVLVDDPGDDREADRCECGGEYEFSRYCGCRVCDSCDDHKGLARCYCGWSASGGDGRAELEDMGERIEEDY